jgi:hypothetical protein
MTRRRRSARTLSKERGDVPGWVLATLMTGGLSTIISRRTYLLMTSRSPIAVSAFSG